VTESRWPKSRKENSAGSFLILRSEIPSFEGFSVSSQSSSEAVGHDGRDREKSVLSRLIICLVVLEPRIEVLIGSARTG